MKRWLIEEKNTIAKRRALEVQNAQQLNEDAVWPKTRGGGKRSRVEGGETTPVRPVKKVAAPANSWHWPSF